MSWTVRYADGSRFDHDGLPPPDMIRCGVQVVVQDDERVGREILRSSDGFWYWKGGRWYETDTMGMWDYLFHHDGPLFLLFGRWIPDAEYEAIVGEEVAAKSAWKKHERRP